MRRPPPSPRAGRRAVRIPAAGTYDLQVGVPVVVTPVTSRTVRPYDLCFPLRSGTPAPEAEVNDTSATATALPGRYTSGSHDTAADQDWYSSSLNAGDSLHSEAGNDLLIDRRGTATLSGGSGADRRDAQDSSSVDRRKPDRITCGADQDIVRADASDNRRERLRSRRPALRPRAGF